MTCFPVLQIAPVSWSAELNASGTALKLFQDKCYVATQDARGKFIYLITFK